MIRRYLAAVGAGASLALPFSLRAAESPLANARESVAQWVQTQQLISRTRTEWESDKEMLTQSKALFERELKSVQEEMAKQTTNSSVADAERLKLDADLKRSNEALETARHHISSLETEFRALLPLLPEPVLSGAQQLLNRLPADSSNTKASVTERVQTLVSLLSEVDKFNNAVTVFTEKRRNAQGEEVSVETVYVGLGAAYFVNESGNFAGAGTPGEKGWKWTADPTLAADVRETIRIYRNERTARFVPLPVAIR
ncbi:MAG TPA: DUF3450 family protein [Verrucomicrobiota bacterium]|nr:DUF3450 family protein [Verrucomicrobiota bacterium]